MKFSRWWLGWLLVMVNTALVIKAGQYVYRLWELWPWTGARL